MGKFSGTLFVSAFLWLYALSFLVRFTDGIEVHLVDDILADKV
jgi:hypothetical protein